MSDHLPAGAEGSWSPSSESINPMTFRQVVDDHPIVVIHFWAIWNWHDRRMDRTLEELKPAFEDYIDFRSFNIDADPGGRIGRASAVGNVPALACFLYGQRVETIIGLRTASELDARFEGWLVGIYDKPVLYGPHAWING